MAGGARPTPRQLFAEIGDVARDFPGLPDGAALPQMASALGGTPDEVATDLPGDALLPQAQFRATRAITIDAPPSVVWPWLVQVGCGRAGWYSNDLLDNLAHPSATTIVSNLQHLEVGQWVPMAPTPSPSKRNAFKVDSFEVNKWLLWAKPDSTWAWQLTLTHDGRTRLLTRTHVVYECPPPISSLATTEPVVVEAYLPLV